jgi:valyl-tRNA synthetase
MTAYKLTWDEFSSWYLEMIKPEYQQPIDRITHDRTIDFFEILMKVLHPFMPFITEEIWHQLRQRGEGDDIIIAPYPVSSSFEPELIKHFDLEREVIIAIRNERANKNISSKEKMNLFVRKNHGQQPNTYFDQVVVKMGNLSSLNYTEEKIEGAASFIVGSTEFFLPLETETINIEAEVSRLEKDLDYARGFLAAVMSKLNNENFVNSAPAKVVEIEKKKQADAESKIRVIEAQIANLRNKS